MTSLVRSREPIGQRHQRAPILLAHVLDPRPVDQRTSGFEFLQHMSSSAGGVIVTPDSARTLVDTTSAVFVREIHADPHDHGQTFVNGHDLGEEPAIFASPTIRSFATSAPVARRTDERGRARRERHAGDDELELIRCDVRSQQDRAQQRRTWGDSIDDPVVRPGALKIGQRHQTSAAFEGRSANQVLVESTTSKCSIRQTIELTRNSRV